MHLEVMSFKLIFSVEVLLTILTGIAGMDLTVVLFPLYLTAKGRATFFTAIFVILIPRHTILLPGPQHMKKPRSLDAIFNECLQVMLPLTGSSGSNGFHANVPPPLSALRYQSARHPHW